MYIITFSLAIIAILGVAVLGAFVKEIINTLSLQGEINLDLHKRIRELEKNGK